MRGSNASRVEVGRWVGPHHGAPRQDRAGGDHGLTDGHNPPAAGDCWAVGGVNGHGLIDHLADGSWQVAAQPASGFYAVSCASATDCWVIGGSAAGTATLGFAHYNGRAWSTVAGPPQGALTSLSCLVSNEALLGGRRQKSERHHTRAAAGAIRRQRMGGRQRTGGSDGKRARRQRPPGRDLCRPHSLLGWWAATPRPPQSCSGTTTGTAWAVTPGPAGVNALGLESLACAGPDDCWAVGYGVAHYDGSGWAVLSSPSWPGLGPPALLAVSCAAANDCWAVGEQFNSDAAAEETLVEHWQGSEWTAVVSTPPTGIELNGVACSGARRLLGSRRGHQCVGLRQPAQLHVAALTESTTADAASAAARTSARRAAHARSGGASAPPGRID